MWAHTLIVIVAVWHSTFMLGAMSALMPVAVVDYLAFKSFQSFHALAEYQWSVAVWRWTQAIIVGGLGATIFKGITG